MHLFFMLLVPFALAAVALTLGAGVYSMMRGGEFALKWSNKLMRLRVGLHAVAIMIVLAAIATRGH